MELKYMFDKLRQRSAKLGMLIEEWNAKFNKPKSHAVSADGVSGCLLRTLNGYTFRVYHKESREFVDYDLMHSDLHVIIQDKDAYFYSSKDSDRLDHSPATLGIKE